MNDTIAGDLRRVQLRTTAMATLALVVVLAIAGYALVNLFERELMRQLDAQLVNASDRIGQLAATAAASPVATPRMDTPGDLVQVIDTHGNVAFSSTSLQNESALWNPNDGERQPLTTQTNSHGPLRVSAVRFGDRWVVLGESLQPVQDAVASLKKAMLIGLPPLALVLAVLLWAVVGRTLRPVAAAVEREEQLIGDVSHELRSPLAGLRVLLETEPSQPQEVELSRIEALATLSRLETITEQLLVLTRHDHQPRPGARHPVDLDEIVLHEVGALASRLPLRVDTINVGPGQVLGHEDDLVSLVDNLLENAARHARTDIAVSLHEEAGTVELAVEDDGPGIEPKDRDRIFERFTRLDEARSRDRGGAGLGLAIVQAIVDGHDGSIRVDDSSLGGARFVVQLPASTIGDASDTKHESTARDTPPPPDPVDRPSAARKQ